MSIDPSRRPTVVRIDHTKQQASAQGQSITPIVNSATAPGTSMSSYGIRMGPGHLSNAHVHHRSDVLVQILHGWAATLWGEEMEAEVHGPGQQVLIPAGVPHAALNVSLHTQVLALEFRTDPDNNRDVELLPDLDPAAAARVRGLHDDHADRVLRALAEGRMSW
jgi:uncharacterized RmlC-like cupin family protein